MFSTRQAAFERQTAERNEGEGAASALRFWSARLGVPDRAQSFCVGLSLNLSLDLSLDLHHRALLVNDSSCCSAASIAPLIWGMRWPGGRRQSGVAVISFERLALGVWSWESGLGRPVCRYWRVVSPELSITEQAKNRLTWPGGCGGRPAAGGSFG